MVVLDERGRCAARKPLIAGYLKVTRRGAAVSAQRAIKWHHLLAWGGGGGIPRNNIVLYYSAVLGRLRKIHGTEGLMGHKDKYRWVRFTYSGNRFGLAPYARFASPSAILFQLFISCFAANLSFRNGVKKKWEREFRARTFFKIFQMYVIVRTVKKKNTSIKMTKKKKFYLSFELL